MHRGVVIYTWGNVSGIDQEKGLAVIKPSGVDYNELKLEDMVFVNIMTGETDEGHYKPLSDMPTHFELYRAFPSIVGVAHTCSINTFVFAQAGISISAIETTHADYFYGDNLCTRKLKRK